MILWSSANQDKVETHHITVGEHQIRKSQYVRNIDAVFDSLPTMEQQVTKTIQTAWYHLFSISKMKIHLTLDQTKCLILAFVTSRLDSNNSFLSAIPSYLLTRLQKVQNAAAKVILDGDRTDHVTPLLKELHWLPLP